MFKATFRCMKHLWVHPNAKSGIIIMVKLRRRHPWRHISLGGDSDTQACITGGIAQAFYGGFPRHIEYAAFASLDDHLRSATMKFMQCSCGKVNSFKGIKKYQSGNIFDKIPYNTHSTSLS